MISRRKLLSAAAVLSASSALSYGSALDEQNVLSSDLLNCDEIILGENWQFRLEPAGTARPSDLRPSNSGWEPVIVPHTWEALGGSPEYTGVAWYKHEIFAPEAWRDQFVRIEFQAVFHTAHVFLNGAPIGEHVGKGYTAFTIDLSPRLKLNSGNELMVRVDNSFSNPMLPRQKSFDWANDGGITRPVRLLITPRIFIESLEIEAVPDLERDVANVSICVLVRNSSADARNAILTANVREYGSTAPNEVLVSMRASLPPNSSEKVRLAPVQIASPKLWHFDFPNLYWAEAQLKAGGQAHSCGDRFGIRKFEIRGTAFYLNGEQVSLIGVERMAGSNPQFGMAESADWIEANHRDMKELNCVFTRVHWPQDRRVLDYCDEHGILMQEEVPAWGSFTFENIPAELQAQLVSNGLEQLREMIVRDRNHPCIVAWGLCNEVNGKNPNSRAFAHALAKEARNADPKRLLTYASNSLRDHPEEDMAGDFDFISANEYFGSWYPGGPQSVREYLDRIRRAFPNKPIVVSEYGWCECQPKIPPGDQARVNIIGEHTKVFRESGEVAGAIYFDYNDYRTIIGDKGTGALRQRVHGVVDLFAARKPSFDALRAQSSPIEELSLSSSGGDFLLRIQTRHTLPAYTLRDYSVRWLFYGYDELPMEGALQSLTPLVPGQAVTVRARPSVNNLKRVTIDILRPTGFSVSRAELGL